MAIVMSANALVQLLLDIVFEALHLLPTRINHLSLTFLNAFISWKTLSAIRKNRFSFMHEDCQILWLMEICLIFGDVWYIIFDEFTWTFIFVRLFFVVCSLFNFVCVTYVMCRYELWSVTYKGHGARRLSIDLSGRRFSIERMFSSLRIPTENPEGTIGRGGDGPDDAQKNSAEQLEELDQTRRSDDGMDDPEAEDGLSDDGVSHGDVEMGNGQCRISDATSHASSDKKDRPLSPPKPPREWDESTNGIVPTNAPGFSSVKLL